MYGKETEVYWNEPLMESEQIYKTSVNESYLFLWSTFGSYLAFIFRGRVSHFRDQGKKIRVLFILLFLAC